MSCSLKIQKLPHFEGGLPEYKSQGASAFDVRACLKEPLTIPPGARALIPLGFKAEVPEGFELQARPRSGLALKSGLSLLNSPGTIDSDYRGELKILLINAGDKPVQIQNQERIAQMAVCPVVRAVFVEKEVLSETSRGEGGFGSTGK